MAKTRQIKITNHDIISMLRKKGLVTNKETITKVFVSIPGGGDWSNTDMNINDEDPIQITVESLE